MKSRQMGVWILAASTACFAGNPRAFGQSGEILLRTGSEPLAACVSPSGTVSVELRLDNLTEAINGVQTVLTYDNSVMSLNTSSSTESSGWSRIILNDAGGNVTYAIVNLGGSIGPISGTPTTLGTLVFDVIDVGATTVDMDDTATKLTPVDHDPLVISGAALTRVNSGVISSDGASASNNGPICAGGTLSLASGTPGAGPNTPYAYEWSGPDAFSSSDQNPTVSTDATTTMSGTYTVTVTNGNGCVFMATTVVTVNANPTPAIGATPGDTICDGGTITLDAGAGYTSYVWTPGGATTQTIDVVTSGNYSVVVIDGNGCSGSDDIDVTVNANPAPTIAAAPGETVCEGETVTLDAGAGYASYLWSPTNEISQTIDVTSGGTYSVVVTDGNGCSGEDDILITVNAAPTPEIVATPGDTVCAGETITLDAGAGYVSYLWSPGGEVTQTIDVVAGGTYSVTVMNGAGCPGADSIDVTVNPNPTITIGATPGATVCDGVTVTLDAGAGFASYLWSPGGEVTQSIDVVTGGNYSVVVVDSNGCIGNDDIDVTVNANPAPTIAATPGDTICAGGTITLDAGAGYASYLWSPGGQTTQTIDVTTTGTYSVTVSDGNTCEGSDSIDVTVNSNPTITIAASPSDTVCAGETVTLDAGAGFSSYLWSPGGETSQTIDVTMGGTYSLLVTDGNGCSGSDDILVTVNPNPTITIVATPGETICAGSSTTLDAGAGYSTYLWSPGGEMTQTIVVSTAGNYSVAVTDSNGCSGGDDIDVMVNTAPVSDAGSNAMACVDENAVVVGGTPAASGGTGPYTILWSGAGAAFLDDPSAANPSFDASAAGVGVYALCVDVTDDNGCVAAQSCMTVTVEACVDINLTVEGLSGNPALPGGPYGAPGGATLTRDVEFVLTDCALPAETQTRVVPINFSPNGVNGSALVRLTGVPAGMDAVSAREGHTLRTLSTVDMTSGLGLAAMTLRSGDVQTETVAQDDLIDIVDFSILSSRWNQTIAATSSLGADVNGDGVQATADFQAMQINFFEVSDPIDECGGRGDGDAIPVVGEFVDDTSTLRPNARSPKRAKSSISVASLKLIAPSAVSADLNSDGVVDATDIRRFATRNGLTLMPEFDRKLKKLEKADQRTPLLPVRK